MTQTWPAQGFLSLQIHRKGPAGGRQEMMSLPQRAGATQSDVPPLSLSSFLFLFLVRQEWAGRKIKRKRKYKEERERVREKFRR
jgi:hypothetical protein